LKTAVVVGNPKPKSRTRDAGILAIRKLTDADPDVVLDLIDLGPALLEFGNDKVAEAVQSVQHAGLAVFASPTFKASYTGILKLFLDQFPPNGLADVMAFPLMLGAGPAHSMAPELFLKPVLVELGATCPAAGLYLIDTTFATDPRLDTWATRARRFIAQATAQT
jgi:FMN reductase